MFFELSQRKPLQHGTPLPPKHLFEHEPISVTTCVLDSDILKIVLAQDDFSECCWRSRKVVGLKCLEGAGSNQPEPLG